MYMYIFIYIYIYIYIYVMLDIPSLCDMESICLVCRICASVFCLVPCLPPTPPSAPWCPAAPVIRPMRLILFISLLHNTPRLGCHVCVDRPPRVVKGAWIFLRHAIKFQEGWACPWHGRGKLLSTGVFVLAGLLRFLGQRSCRLNLLSVFALAGLFLAHVCNDLRSQI